MVSRQHAHSDAGLDALAHGRRHFGTHGIADAKQSHYHNLSVQRLVLEIDKVATLDRGASGQRRGSRVHQIAAGVHVAIADAQSAVGVAGVLGHQLREPGAVGVSAGPHMAVCLHHVVGFGDNDLGSALDKDAELFGGGNIVDCGHVLVGRVVGQLQHAKIRHFPAHGVVVSRHHRASLDSVNHVHQRHFRRHSHHLGLARLGVQLPMRRRVQRHARAQNLVKVGRQIDVIPPGQLGELLTADPSSLHRHLVHRQSARLVRANVGRSSHGLACLKKMISENRPKHAVTKFASLTCKWRTRLLSLVMAFIE